MIFFSRTFFIPLQNEISTIWKTFSWRNLIQNIYAIKFENKVWLFNFNFPFCIAIIEILWIILNISYYLSFAFGLVFYKNNVNKYHNHIIIINTSLQFFRHFDFEFFSPCREFSEKVKLCQRGWLFSASAKGESTRTEYNREVNL